MHKIESIIVVPAPNKTMKEHCQNSKTRSPSKSPRTTSRKKNALGTDEVNRQSKHKREGSLQETRKRKREETSISETGNITQSQLPNKLSDSASSTELITIIKSQLQLKDEQQEELQLEEYGKCGQDYNRKLRTSMRKNLYIMRQIPHTKR